MLTTSIVPNFQCHYNPFGGLKEEEITQVLVPRLDLDHIRNQIIDPNPKVIELVGRKGRGKSSHLSILAQSLSDYPFFQFKQSDDLLLLQKNEASILFIDRIHRLNLRQRLALYRSPKTIVLCSHYRRALEYRLARKAYLSFNLRGIDASVLQQILKNVIALASGKGSAEIDVSGIAVEQLIQKFGDDYRGILNHLYDRFQENKSDGKGL